MRINRVTTAIVVVVEVVEYKHHLEPSFPKFFCVMPIMFTTRTKSKTS